MSWILLIALGWLVWSAFVLRRALSQALEDIARLQTQLEQIRAAQRETMEFMFDAVNNFAIIVGETSEGMEPLSARIQQVRDSLRSPTAKSVVKANA